jgi:putative sugar O-methyltransferase
MLEQEELYRPSVFWDEASKRIIEELNEHGVERLRALQTALSFFAPTYGVPGSSFTAEQVTALRDHLANGHPQAKKAQLGLGQFLGGETAALADYRVLLAADDPTKLPYLHTFSESGGGSPVEQFEFDGRRFSRSALNYLLGLALLKKHLAGDVPRTVLEIGGGFGTLGELVARSGVEGARYIDLDIPPTSFAAQSYLIGVLGVESVATYRATRDRSELLIEELPPASVLCAWQIEKLRGRVDLFVNFISFQEMEPPIVQNYLAHVSRLNARWVLLRNLREGKQKRGHPDHWVGVETPILGDDYLDMLPEYELVERNVHPFGYRTVDGFHSELLLLRRKS